MSAHEHWTSKYVGRPVVKGEFDCAVLAQTVQREVFGKTVELPSERPEAEGVLSRMRDRTTMIAEGKAAFAERTNSPREGDAVLIQTRGYLQHIGTLAFINNDVWVLHTDDRSKRVVLSRAREMGIRGLQIEGYYRWK